MRRHSSPHAELHVRVGRLAIDAAALGDGGGGAAGFQDLLQSALAQRLDALRGDHLPRTGQERSRVSPTVADAVAAHVASAIGRVGGK